MEWRKATALDGNSYNPNAVYSPELRLLETSLLLSGWIQPLLILPAGTIIDGFHRWRLSQDSPAIRDRWGGDVPCVVLDLPRAEAMMLTVRINRAKGTHGALRMHAIVAELLDQHGCTPDRLVHEMGMTRAEVDLLHQEGVFAKKNIKDYRYSKAWEPRDR